MLGFLPFNFPHARIFMGDVGSQFCGFLLAVLAVAAGRFEAVELSVALVPMLLSGVLFDVAFTLLRRFLAGERLAEAHRGHLYQLAHRSGMPAVRVTLVHWGFAAWGGCAALCSCRRRRPGSRSGSLLVLPPQLAWLLIVDRLARAQAASGQPFAAAAASRKVARSPWSARMVPLRLCIRRFSSALLARHGRPIRPTRPSTW